MALVDDIKSRLDIVDLVSERVALQKSGRNFKARCPFHNERTPSFYVFPERQTWRCFGACASGGDAINFIQRIENLDFGETLTKLAQRTGVALPEVRSSHEDRSREQRLLEANEAAVRFYRDTLASDQGQQARDYLQGRGISSDAVAAFELGLAPNNWDALRHHLAGKGFADDTLTQVGLATHTDDGRVRDMFRNRLIVPIRDASSRLVGFGGRALGDVNPKYLNTPQSPLFDKSHLVYALDKAVASIRDLGEGVIVEGYMDVIAAHQRGFNNVVASMGTALTEHQVALLSKHTHRFVLALDPDAAGQEATLRSLETSWRLLERHVMHTSRRGAGMMRRPGTELRIAALPEGRDPDAVLRDAPEQWPLIIENAAPVVEYLISALSTRRDLTTGQGKASVVDEVFPLIAAERNPYNQDRYFQHLASVVGVSVGALKASVGAAPRPSQRRTPRAGADPGPLAAFARDALEEYVLALLVQFPELASQTGDLRSDHFRQPQNRELFTKHLTNGNLYMAESALSQELLEQLEVLKAREFPFANFKEREDALAQCLGRLEERRLKELKVEESMALDQEWAAEQDPNSVRFDVEATERLRSVFQREAGSS